MFNKTFDIGQQLGASGTGLKPAFRVITSAPRRKGYKATNNLEEQYWDAIELNKPESTPRLTKRECEVVQLLASGKSSKEIGWELSISARTVETHRANIMRKLKVHSVTELLHRAIRYGFIESPDKGMR